MEGICSIYSFGFEINLGIGFYLCLYFNIAAPMIVIEDALISSIVKDDVRLMMIF